MRQLQSTDSFICVETTQLLTHPHQAAAHPILSEQSPARCARICNVLHEPAPAAAPASTILLPLRTTHELQEVSVACAKQDLGKFLATCSAT
jgi:hypothetical protein